MFASRPLALSMPVLNHYLKILTLHLLLLWASEMRGPCQIRQSAVPLFWYDCVSSFVNSADTSLLLSPVFSWTSVLVCTVCYPSGFFFGGWESPELERHCMHDTAC